VSSPPGGKSSFGDALLLGNADGGVAVSATDSPAVTAAVVDGAFFFDAAGLLGDGPQAVTATRTQRPPRRTNIERRPWQDNPETM
jgi:DNA-binding beta-propeller fold protein YncE